MSVLDLQNSIATMDHRPSRLRIESKATMGTSSIQSLDPSESQSWIRVIHALDSWLFNPPDVEEGGSVPSPTAIQLGIDLALKMQHMHVPPPLRVVPNGEGGVAFERRADGRFHVVEIFEDGTAETTLFEDCKLVNRAQIALTSI